MGNSFQESWIKNRQAVNSEALAVETPPPHQLYLNTGKCLYAGKEGVFQRVHREVTEKGDRDAFYTGLKAFAVSTRAALIPVEK